MAANDIICHCHQVDYVTIRKAMIGGARTLKDIKDLTGAGSGCSGCQTKVEEILARACTCNDISMEDVKEAIANGATTVEEVGVATKAGTTCTRCQALVANVIELG